MASAQGRLGVGAPNYAHAPVRPCALTPLRPCALAQISPGIVVAPKGFAVITGDLYDEGNRIYCLGDGGISRGAGSRPVTGDRLQAGTDVVKSGSRPRRRRD